jgi:hypothetical protein
MANLYWNGSNSEEWADVLNWWTDASATIQADNAPWINGETNYIDYNLTLATSSFQNPLINYGISISGNGICDLPITNFFGNIVSGTFTGSIINVNASDSYISGGTFTGAITNNGTITGGTFTGAFSNSWLVVGGTFSSGAITITQNGGNTLLAISGGPTYSYPTPASGGGSSGVNISRLLNLPWFIKI